MNWKARFEFRILGLLGILSQDGTGQGVWAPFLSTPGSIPYKKEL